MRFTIVTISYNQAQFLEAALASVLQQDCADLEYIVADGGSTDGSLDIIGKYRGRISRILSGPDGGPASALNRAFAQATGDVFGFINSDDVLLPGALRAVADQLSQRPETGFISGHCLITDETGRVMRKSYSDAFDLRYFAHGACILLQPATFFRRGLFEKVGGFNAANPVSWDAELFFNFGLVGAEHALINRILAAYRVHSQSITGENRSDEIRRRLRDQRLRQYLGREIGQADRRRAWVYKYLRKLTNPRDTWQRLVGGPIGGQFRLKS